MQTQKVVRNFNRYDVVMKAFPQKFPSLIFVLEIEVFKLNISNRMDNLNNILYYLKIE